MNSLGINESRVKQENDHPIKVSTPYWLHFIFNHYHYLPLSRAVFNFSKIAKFFPESFFISSLQFLTVKSCSFNITNLQLNKNLSIIDAFTTSRNIIIKQIIPTTLSPGSSLKIEFIILPIELIPTFSTVIMVSTNMGTFPFFVSCQQDITGKNSTVQTLFHECSAMKSNLSILLSPHFGKRIISVYYDALLFHTGKSTMAKKFLIFNILQLKNGFYVSFINFISQDFQNTTLPLYLCVSSKFLQSFYPVILVNVVTSPTSTGESEIRIVNPTPHQFTIISVTLQKDSPSNLKVELNPQPVICPKFSYTSIGRVFVNGNKQGKILSSITVLYETIIDFTKITQFIEIPVHASVIHGYMEPSEKQISLLQTHNSFAKVNFTNHFKVPVAIISARTDSSVFRVVDFIPNVVFPGETSENIVVQFMFFPFSYTFESVLFVETNITNYYIPIKGYNGQLTISKTNSSVTQMFIYENLGKVMTGSTMKFVFFIRNPNPIRYVLNDYNATPGITVNGFWNTNEFGPLRGHQMLPFAIEEIHIYVGFNSIRSNKPRNDSISIGAVGSFVQIMLQWKPVNGHYFLSMYIPKVHYFGFEYHTEISLNSTYPSSMKLNNFSINIPNSVTYTKSPLIIPNIFTYIGYFDIIFDTRIFKDTKMMDLFDSRKSWVDLKKLWAKSWPNEIEYEMELTMYIKPNIFFKFKYPTLLTTMTFPDLECDLGYILSYVEKHGSVLHHNFFNTSIAYHFHPRVSAHSDHEELVAMNNSDILFSFTVVSTSLGDFVETIPITTNATKPFFLKIRAKVVAPNVHFVDFFGEKIDRAVISSKSPAFPTCSIFLINKGLTNVEIGQFFVRSPLFTFSQKCTGILPINSTCRVDITVAVDYIRNKTEESTLLLYVHGLQVMCKLAVILDDKAMKEIKNKALLKYLIIISFALILPLYEVFTCIYNNYQMSKNIECRCDSLKSEVEKLSVSIKSSIATQIVINHGEVSCGKWIPATEIRQFITSEAIELLEEELNSLT